MTDPTPRKRGRNAAKIAPKPIRWLVPNVLAQGLATCLTGAGGVGKSTLMVRWAADLSRGRPLVPGGKTPPVLESVIVSTEDSAESVIVPKLDANGADKTKVTIFDYLEVDDGEGGTMKRGLSLPGDTEEILGVVRDTGAALLILDPVSELLDDKHSSNNEQEVRRALRRLRSGCEELGCSLVWLQHWNQQGKPMGSVAWRNMARIGLQVARHPDDRTRSVLFQDKSNHGEAPAWEFHVEPVTWDALYEGAVDDPDHDNTTARIVWDGPSSLSPDDIQSGSVSPEQREEHDDAVVVWRRNLGDVLDERTGRWAEGTLVAWTKDVEREARELGVTAGTLRRARARLGLVKTRSHDFGEGGRWGWQRPAKAHANGHRPHEPVPPPAEDRGVPVCGTCGVPVDPDAGCRRCANARVVWKIKEDLS